MGELVAVLLISRLGSFQLHYWAGGVLGGEVESVLFLGLFSYIDESGNLNRMRGNRRWLLG